MPWSGSRAAPATRERRCNGAEHAPVCYLVWHVTAAPPLQTCECLAPPCRSWACHITAPQDLWEGPHTGLETKRGQIRPTVLLGGHTGLETKRGQIRPTVLLGNHTGLETKRGQIRPTVLLGNHTGLETRRGQSPARGNAPVACIPSLACQCLAERCTARCQAGPPPCQRSASKGVQTHPAAVAAHGVRLPIAKPCYSACVSSHGFALSSQCVLANCKGMLQRLCQQPWVCLELTVCACQLERHVAPPVSAAMGLP
eukprot:363738-Chlamydomonas_euryale.AAC.9